MTRVLSERSAQTSAPVRHPGIATPVGAIPSQHDFNVAVKQILETGTGVRGSRFDKWVTLREIDDRLVELGIASPGLTIKPPAGIPENGMAIPVVGASGKSSYLSMDAFALQIGATKLYRDLMRRIDDPSRFEAYHERTKAELLSELAPIDGKFGAEIRMVQEQFATATEAFAQDVTTLRASVARAAAGVRTLRAVSASENRATALVTTQITARLDGFDGGAATVETVMSAIADRATGLEAQYTVKVTAGGAVAGFGIAATEVTGTPSSAFIIQADKFAIVSSSYAGGLDNTPPAANIMFGVDGDGTYVGGNLKVDGIALINGNTTGTAYSISYNSAMVVNTSGTSINGITSFTDDASGGALIGYSVGGGNAVYGVASGGTAAIGVHGVATGANSNFAGVGAEGNGGALAIHASGPSLFEGSVQISTASTFTTNGQIISTVATGTAPLTIASTTLVANLHAANSDALGTYTIGNWPRITGSALSSPGAADAYVQVTNGTATFKLLAVYVP